MKAESDAPEIANSQYQELPQLIHLPGSQFGILWRDQFGSAKSPADITRLSTLAIPFDNAGHIASNTSATFDSDGGCHLVFDDFGRGLYYTFSKQMQTWSPPQLLAVADKNSSISKPQLFIEGDKTALIYETNSGSWLARGTILPGNLQLGSATQIADHTMSFNGARVQVAEGRVKILAGVGHYNVGAVSLNAKCQGILALSPLHQSCICPCRQRNPVSLCW